jgi:hypothetical protein
MAIWPALISIESNSFSNITSQLPHVSPSNKKNQLKRVIIANVFYSCKRFFYELKLLWANIKAIGKD